MQGPSTVATASVRARSLAEHQRLDELLGPMLVAHVRDGPVPLVTLWAEVESGLAAHLRDEELHLIPALLEARPRDAYVLLEEHRHLRSRVTEIAAAIEGFIPCHLAIRNFRDELRAHAQTESRLLYEWADDHLRP